MGNSGQKVVNLRFVEGTGSVFKGFSVLNVKNQGQELYAFYSYFLIHTNIKRFKMANNKQVRRRHGKRNQMSERLQSYKEVCNLILYLRNKKD